MTLFPTSLDSDNEIPRIDDEISELSVELFNALRDAVLQIEKALGIKFTGSLNNLASFLQVSFNSNGTLKQSAIAEVGLIKYPIDNQDVGTNAGIVEDKLKLNYNTNLLHDLILNDQALLLSLQNLTTVINNDLNSHFGGSKGRHLASQLDINAIPSSPGDPNFTWSGLKDKNNVVRSATTIALALLQINDDLISHENSISEVHLAQAIVLNSNTFENIPLETTNVQKLAQYLDQNETLNIGEHRATQHVAGIPIIARSHSLTFDGYGSINIVPATTVTTYLVHPPFGTPIDSISFGDNVVIFTPANNNNFVFDALFSQVKINDVIRINYNNGLEAEFFIESIRYINTTQWVVRINGSNLLDTTFATARIDRPNFDANTSGVLATAVANANPINLYSDLLGSIILGHPKGATALGLNFDPNELDSNHYLLYLQLFPDGNPLHKIINLPGIDVTGNLGITPGKYTLNDVVQNTNDAFRTLGYNYRFISFAYQGQFGLMLADAINKVSFSIISGDNTSGTLFIGSFVKNVIGIDNSFDSLGFGSAHANLASPAYQSVWIDSLAAQIPTKIITPARSKFYIANGLKRDSFALGYLTIGDGFWPATILNRTVTGTSVEVTYKVSLNLSLAKLKIGKTLVVQPAIDFSDFNYLDLDYGRFIIKLITFSEACGNTSAFTLITVINGIHATGSGLSNLGSAIGLNVKLYFSDDSVGFNSQQLNEGNSIWSAGTSFHRFHEIYVTSEGQSFAHERAKLPVQVETGNLLRTDLFHLTDISPKLRGYADDNIKHNKYLRFYCSGYDPVSGSYDGYIGQRDPLSINIFKSGPITSARKNIPTKFYDETNIDFIELQYLDNFNFPGVDVLTNSLHRYVDIEIFPSMRLNDELLFLSSCEVNYLPSSNQEIIQFVKDRRQFGSIDEIDFSNSALEYISAGDRYLHSNGIIKGLSFDYINVSDNRQIFFKGGICLVNGNIVTINNVSVTIPQVYPYGSSLPQIVTWAICVNQFKELIPIIITTSKDQFFVTTNGVNSYYLPSVTFAELILTRRDLTPIYLVTAHIASFTISNSDLKDIRKFVRSEGSAQSLTWSSDKEIGHFNSFESLKNWIQNFNNNDNYVIVKGIFNLTSALDFTGFTHPVVFEGVSATFIVTIPKGILLGSNVILRNFNFIYNPVGITYGKNALGVYPDLVNYINGCIYLGSQSNYYSTNIENCQFTSSTANSQRPPFISFVLDNSDILKNFNIKSCKFNDSASTGDQAAIAIITKNSKTDNLAYPAGILNVNITNNDCNLNQGIYLTTKSYFEEGGLIIHSPGLNIFNCYVAGNNCGVIGFIASSMINDRNHLLNSGLTIERNRCHYIATLEATGLNTILEPHPFETIYGSGKIIIRNNQCNWIHCKAQDNEAEVQRSALIISENILTAFDDDYLQTKYLNNSPVDSFYNNRLDTAIIIYTYQFLGTGSPVYQIINNNIDFGLFSPGNRYQYFNGIFCISSAEVSGNIIKGFGSGSDASGIILTNNGGSGISVPHYNIHHNQIFKKNANIASYIQYKRHTNSNEPSIFNCHDNFFDDYKINNDEESFIDVIKYDFSNNRAKITNNINHQVKTLISNSEGSITLNNFLLSSEIAATDSFVKFNGFNNILFNYQHLDNEPEGGIPFKWRVNLTETIPLGVKIISVSVHINTNPQIPADSSVIFNLISPQRSTTDISFISTFSQTFDYSIADNQEIINQFSSYSNTAKSTLELKFIPRHDMNLNFIISDFFVTFRY